jgi:hypothetical protein
MKTFKDLFLNESADIDDTPRRTIKASLRMATAENGPDPQPAPAGSNGDDTSESDQKKVGGGGSPQNFSLRPSAFLYLVACREAQRTLRGR